VEIGIPELTDEQFEEVSQTAENAARRFIFSKVNQKMVEKLDISVEAEGTKPVNVIVEVDLALSREIKNFDVNALTEEAVKEAFKPIEDYMRKLK
jgi:predicted dinucleotide-utilizing enzyme